MKKLILCGLVCALCALPAPALADSGATATLKAAVDQVLSILRGGDYADPAKKPALREKLDPIVREVFDFGELSMRTVGRTWRSFSKAQQDEFASLFAELLTETYIDRIQSYSDEEVLFTGEREGKDGKVEVQTVVKTSGNEIPLNYRMLPTDKGMQVYDVFVEGVSLVKNYREQFKEILVNGTADDLLDTLRKKVQAMKETPQS